MKQGGNNFFLTTYLVVTAVVKVLVSMCSLPIRPIVSYSGSPLYNRNKYIANILKPYVKDENNNARKSTKFSNYIKNFPIEADEIMVSFYVTSLFTNILIIDTLNIYLLIKMISFLGKRLYLKTSFLI